VPPGHSAFTLDPQLKATGFFPFLMKTERHNFDLGDIVTVFNRALGGKFVIEGKAKIV
jgi:hypothetical protein